MVQNGSGPAAVTRRDLLALVGAVAGSAAMLRTMTSLGLAAESTFAGPVRLEGDPKAASVLVLGAGLAGMTAALELRDAGYRVRVLEYNTRPGGRNWTLRGGDRYTELGGARQDCGFAPGLYLNPGPWRIPYHHRAVLHYCKRLGVALEPFVQLNHNAYLHASGAFGGRPQRIREVKADFQGHVADLLAKAAHQDRLDDALSVEDKAVLLEALKDWGALDDDYGYRASLASAAYRGPGKAAGGGLGAAPTASEPVGRAEVLDARLWRYLGNFAEFEFQTTLMQPVGGMDRIGHAFGRALDGVIRYGRRVTGIRQTGTGVAVTHADAGGGGPTEEDGADWCVCTLPLSVLSRIPLDAGPRLKAAVNAVPYTSATKIGLQFRRRFWEEDEAIYGGITYTDLPIRQIGYPAAGLGAPGPGVLLGAYLFGAPNSYEFAAMAPADRVARAVELGARIHPQYRTEFDTGVAVAWHRVPSAMGCSGGWTEAARAAHYDDLCQIDGRIVLAGEHASYLPAWQEGAILSSLDAVTRLHARVVRG